MTDKDTHASRRKLLKAVGAGAFASGMSSLAGCSGGDGGSGDGGGGKTTTTSSDGGDGGGGGGSSNIKIGVLAPLTGPFVQSGKSTVRGGELAIEKINQSGGVGGTKLEMVKADTQTTPKEGAKQAKRLIESENCDVILGGVSSSVGLAIASVAKDKKTPYIGGISAAPITKAKCNPYTFTNNSRVDMMAHASLPWMAKNAGMESVYFISADYTWGQTAWQYYQKLMPELNVEIKGNSFAPFGAKDFSSQISKAMNSGADTVYLTLWGDDQVKCLNQLAQYNAREKFKNIGNAWGGVEIFTGVNDGALDGVISGGPYYWNYDTPQNNEFVKAFEGKFDKKPVMSAAVMYGSTYHLLKTAQEVGTIETKKLLGAFEGKKIEPYYKGGNALVRGCDHQIVYDWMVLEGKAPDERESELDLLNVRDVRNGQDIVGPCSDECKGLPAWQ